MTKSIRIDAEADDEISHAIDRYEREREGLGAEFWTSSKRRCGRLRPRGMRPVIGLPRELGVRRESLARSPSPAGLLGAIGWLAKKLPRARGRPTLARWPVPYGDPGL